MWALDSQGRSSTPARSAAQGQLGRRRRITRTHDPRSSWGAMAVCDQEYYLNPETVVLVPTLAQFA
jgi:hypothetical protein